MPWPPPRHAERACYINIAQFDGSSRRWLVWKRAAIRAPHVWIAYAARDWNHPRMSSEETSCKAGPIAVIIASVVRAATDRSVALTFENISSIGVRSGLDDGKGMTRALAASTARTTDSAWCGWRLSQITTSPGFSCGT